MLEVACHVSSWTPFQGVGAGWIDAIVIDEAALDIGSVFQQRRQWSSIGPDITHTRTHSHTSTRTHKQMNRQSPATHEG
jgi:hypothetical protein